MTESRTPTQPDPAHQADSPRILTARDGFALAMSSTAPAYSVLVTAPLMADLVGAGVWLAYALAAVPAFLIALGMNANDRRDPDKGTVYAWSRRISHRLGWFSGFCLFASGVICTSGMAYVTVSILLPHAPPWVRFLAGVALIALTGWLDAVHLRLTSLLQQVALVVQVAAAAYLAWELAAGHAPALKPVSGSPVAWVHAVLLAVFAYWGFDAIFALTDETDDPVPARVSLSTMASLVVLFGVAGLAYATSTPAAAVSHPLVKLAVLLSALLSLGSTVLPTARGIEAMAERRELPAFLQRPFPAVFATVALACGWLVIVLLNGSLFDDSIEALSVFVGLYFTVSSLAAARFAASARGRLLHGAAAALMAGITVVTAVQSFAKDYGATSFANVGGVGIIVAVLFVAGLAAAFACARRREAL